MYKCTYLLTYKSKFKNIAINALEKKYMGF